MLLILSMSSTIFKHWLTCLLCRSGLTSDDEGGGYECLKEIDPVAAQRIHPNDHRKVRVLPNFPNLLGYCARFLCSSQWCWLFCVSLFYMCFCFGKIKRYLELYATTGALPSNLFQGKAAKVRNFAIVVSSVLFSPAQVLVECPLFFSLMCCLASHFFIFLYVLKTLGILNV